MSHGICPHCRQAEDDCECISIAASRNKEGEGKKHDVGKMRLDLIPPEMTLAIGRVLTMGAEKYGDRNWEKGFDWSRSIAALKRHLTAWECRQDNDVESGYCHLDHVLCNVAFLIAFYERGVGNDDRPFGAKYDG